MSPKRKQPPQIAICSLRQDLPKAQEICTHLLARGVSCLLVTDTLKGGKNWARPLRKRIKEANGLIVCLRPGFDALGQREAEVITALEAARELSRDEEFFIPFVVEPVPGAQASTLEDLVADLKKRYSLPKRKPRRAVGRTGKASLSIKKTSAPSPRWRRWRGLIVGIPSSLKLTSLGLARQASQGIRQQSGKIRRGTLRIRDVCRQFLSAVLRWRPEVSLLATVIPAVVIAFIALLLFWPWDLDGWGAELFGLSSVSGEERAALQPPPPVTFASGPLHEPLVSRETAPSRHGYRPEAVVIHVIPKAKTKTAHSFHYRIDRNGETRQYAAEEATAFHLGPVNRSEWTLLKPAVDPNYYTIGIVHEAEGNHPWSDQSYQVGARLIAQIAQRWNLPVDRRHVIGHYEISGSDAAGLDPNDPTRSLFCPGTGIDLDHLVGLAAAEAASLKQPPFVAQTGVVTTLSSANLRESPSTQGVLAGSLPANYPVRHAGWVTKGESVEGKSTWYKTDTGQYLWADATDRKEPAAPPTRPANPPAQPYTFVPNPGTVVTLSGVNLRRLPKTDAELVQNYPTGTEVAFTGWVTDGESVQRNSHWHRTVSGYYLWAGGTNVTRPRTP